MLDFKKGDIVRLKSGGPEMTIEKIGQYNTSQEKAQCTWFDDKELKSHIFVLESLEKIR